MRIFLTGATGYIGGRLARRLAADGHAVRALVRDAATAPELAAVGIEAWPGDLLDPASLVAGMRGAQRVVHAAAALDLRRDRDRMAAVNVHGSENIAAAVTAVGGPPLLALGSVAVFGGSPEDGSAADETTPPRPPATLYGETKRAGIEALRRWAASGQALDIVHPSLVYGPPAKRSGANALLRALALGRIPFLVAPRRRSSWVHIDDLVEGLIRVLGRPRPGGGEWLMSGDVISVRDLAARVAHLAGRRPPRWVLPLGAVRWAQRLTPALVPSQLAPEQVRSLDRPWVFDDRKARAEFDWRPRDLATGLPPTVAHLLAPAT